MKRLLASLVLLGAAAAHAAPASQESVERLLAVTRADTMMESMYVGVEQVMRQAVARAVQGRPVKAEQQRVLDAIPRKFAAVMREEMAWPKMKPLYLQLYQETFEQDEIDGMLAFYATPAGRATLDKMPVVIQKSFALSQTLMQSVMPKMDAAMKEALAEAKLAPAR